MAKQVTTIYIDDSGIWLLIARGRQVRKWASMPLPPSLVRSGVILDQDAVANRVKELWRSQRIGTSRRKRKVVAGISGINCLHHLLRLPEIPRDLLPEAVKREADRVLGVHVEQLYLYWQALPSVAGEMVVYLTASLRNSVDALIKTLKKAGLRPYLADLKPLALARTSTEPSAIIIDVQPASFDIVIVTEGIPQVIRSVPLTQDTLPDGKVSLVSEELNRAVTFYNSSHADKPIDTSPARLG
jgi:type IV pilus assembly protein PilM